MKDYKTHKFLKLLDSRNIKYHYEGRWLVIDGGETGNVNLYGCGLGVLPDYIKFNNKKNIYLHGNKLISLPDNIEFNNSNDIYLTNNPLESLPDNIDEFYSRLSVLTKEYITKNFPDHWIHDKERFGL